MTMIGALALCLTVQAQAATLETDAGAIVSKVFEKYWNARTLMGTIVQTSSDGGGALKITTKVTFERPGHILVQQDYVGKNGLPLSLVSDGKKFAYDPPWNMPGIKIKPKERLMEPALIERPGQQNKILAIGDMYHAAHVSLMPSTVLDLAIAYRDHLSDFVINVGTTKLEGVVSYQGKQAYRIVGVWQAYKGAVDVQARYELLVSTGFDLLRFQLTQPYLIQGKTVLVTTVETADLKIDVPIDRSIFVVK